MGWRIKALAMLPLVCLYFSTLCCNNNTKYNLPKATVAINGNRLLKPSSSYQDTMVIKGKCAVFYYPDSVQLIKYQALVDTNAYKSIDHEFMYQLHYAHIAIKKYWPLVSIAESKHYRYVKFIKTEGAFEYVDLNTYGDIYGLIIFDGKKKPQQVDLTNVETQMGFYFQDK